MDVEPNATTMTRTGEARQEAQPVLMEPKPDRAASAIPPRPQPIPNPKRANGEPIHFSNPAEEAFSRVLDFYQIPWEYEPMTFPLEWDAEGRVTNAFSPDFYLASEDTYIELTTMKQSLVTKKNRKLRLLHELYPNVHCKLMYRRDVANLAVKYGLFEEVPEAEIEACEEENGSENGK